MDLFADRPDLVSVINGEPVLSTKAFAYLVGVSEEEITAEWKRQNGEAKGSFRLPKGWLRNAKEIQARHGTTDFSVLFPLLIAERESGLGH